MVQQPTQDRESPLLKRCRRDLMQAIDCPEALVKNKTRLICCLAGAFPIQTMGIESSEKSRLPPGR